MNYNTNNEELRHDDDDHTDAKDSLNRGRTRQLRHESINEWRVAKTDKMELNERGLVFIYIKRNQSDRDKVKKMNEPPLHNTHEPFIGAQWVNDLHSLWVMNYELWLWD